MAPAVPAARAITRLVRLSWCQRGGGARRAPGPPGFAGGM